MDRKAIKRGLGRQEMAAKDFCFACEVEYIQARAVERIGRFVIVNEVALFSTETGDAWLLDPEGHLAAPLARDGNPEPINFGENETKFFINWKGKYRIDGKAFVYTDQDSGRVLTILGYPTSRIAEL